MARADAAEEAGQGAVGLYVHVPFCVRRCPYCDFYAQAGRDETHAPYVAAVEREIEHWARVLAGRSVTSVFVGGGTPTVLAAPLLARVLGHIRAALNVSDGAEITCEANPGAVDRARFDALCASGLTRLSLGAQSLEPDELTWLGRIHTADDVARAVGAARAAGVENISVDLMFGLPGQDAAAWSRTLDGVLALGPEHLSLYCLTVEPGTVLAERIAAGTLPAPDDDAAADRFEEAMARLAAAGYGHYEVSNWAREAAGESAGESVGNGRTPRLACRHNLVYWRHGEYVGVGAGAHGHLRRERGTSGAVAERWWNVRSIDGYVARMAADESPLEGREAIDRPTAMGETMMLGLRLLGEGVAHERFRALHGREPRAVFGPELAALAGAGLVEVDDERTRLTRRGLLLGNQVFARFVGGG